MLLTLFSHFSAWALTFLEFLLVVPFAALALLRGTRKPAGWIAQLQARFHQLARRRVAWLVVIAVVALVTRAALIPALGVTRPLFEDEFSLNLAADTFAHGRLTNPPHPMWVHFESFHILQQPTYMSMYPPAQGLVLAAGQLLGNPWLGNLLAMAAMCAGMGWMLQAWVPPPWALLGAILVWLRLAILAYWMNSYWPGGLAALAGAMVLGAYPRITRSARVRDAVVMAVGVAILANTRPYEGLVLCLPLFVAMVAWIILQKKFPARTVAYRVVLPVAAILITAGLATGYYNWRVTGNPFLMPQQLDRDIYAVAPYFLWQHLRPVPIYHHAAMRSFYTGWEVRDFEGTRSFFGLAHWLLYKAVLLWRFFIGPIFTIPLLALPWAVRRRKMALPLAIAAVFCVGLACEIWTSPHYAAPATCVLYLLIVQSMRHLQLWRRRHRNTARALVRLIPALCAGIVVIRIALIAVHVQVEPRWPHHFPERERISAELQHTPGNHLVIVQYRPDHETAFEWVYNAADIDHSRIVWARDMGLQNAELLHYFSDRRAWVVNGDDPHPQLIPYSSTLTTGITFPER